MPHRYLTALDTPSVMAAQREYGSHTAMRRLIAGWDTGSVLGEEEIAFIGERDSFYLGTTGESGWPYVQHRGGPPGFLKVLDDEDGHSVLGWADYRGNRQYVSAGNLRASSRVSLFLMDYAGRQRLKILGEAQVADARHETAAQTADTRRDGTAALLARVATPDYAAHVERVITVRVHAFDWNCPQHITPRWTRAELAPALDGLHRELDELRDRNRRLAKEIAALRRPS
ncbi:pyridoxamine 5'-phosphate oxidase family protein [Actinoplanes sp. NBRC 101535]|uniref:pyridoxamine 5'-phosphate oxidase family protein n=1 Tax=Actinoplanes sp. NBRC 101535 TaxID=3032196 RepID=UPI0024A5FDB6|nr:pyridoxamine 5'-phosphate oxidase family protein [Actinoplanes sp. NBRC 101535]GLY06508.1 pyridoxamine 5'-phosphate oxidase [Actinoplanes sp. NBRC 101535]